MPDFPVTVDPPPQQVTVTIDPPPEAATYTLDNTDVATLLRFVGWPEADIDTACAISCAEAGADLTLATPTVWADAVGDLNLAGPVWHGSFGFLQIRALRAPDAQYQSVDKWRVPGPALLDPLYCASVALKLKNAYGWGMWSTYANGAYQPYLGKRPKLVTGHKDAAKWWV